MVILLFLELIYIKVLKMNKFQKQESFHIQTQKKNNYWEDMQSLLLDSMTQNNNLFV